MPLQKKLIYLLGIVISSNTLLLVNKTNAVEHIKFLTKMCHITFNSEMSLAGKSAPKGMADFTCDCFIEKISISYSLEAAKEKCKEDASKRFKL